jgi:hypothetical protein
MLVKKICNKKLSETPFPNDTEHQLITAGHSEAESEAKNSKTNRRKLTDTLNL